MEPEDTSRRDITDEEIREIKKLLFGQTTRSFSNAWTKQGLSFKPFPPYCLKQNKSGPCGVLASVQGFVISELLFGSSRIVLKEGFLRPTFPERRVALANAITYILWTARSENMVSIVSPWRVGERKDEKATFGNNMSNLKVECFMSRDDLLSHVKKCLSLFINPGGIIVLMHSLILTRGVNKIREEMDFEDSFWIGYDSYCSQEAINLILVGQAVSNVFDGQRELGSGEDKVTLKGIPGRSKIGFLSLAEYDNHDPVGSFYKDPELPVWVLNGNGHYLVIFGTSKKILTDQAFKLLYADSMGSCEEICLSVEINNDAPENIRGRLPTTIKCILTRWPASTVTVELINRE